MKEKKNRKTYSQEEIREAQESMRTSGKKGMKLPRINLALTPSNYDYVNSMAAMYGISKTEFVNNLIKNDSMNGENAKTYKVVLALRKGEANAAGQGEL